MKPIRRFPLRYAASAPAMAIPPGNAISPAEQSCRSRGLRKSACRPAGPSRSCTAGAPVIAHRLCPKTAGSPVHRACDRKELSPRRTPPRSPADADCAPKEPSAHPPECLAELVPDRLRSGNRPLRLWEELPLFAAAGYDDFAELLSRDGITHARSSPPPPENRGSPAPRPHQSEL